MKKVSAFLLAVMMLFMCASCGDKEPEEVSTIQATYSVKSMQKNEFIVEVQDLGGVYSELYDEIGIYITFDKSEKIYEADGTEISSKDLLPGDTLEIHYSGKLHKNSPKTIKAYKVVRILK